MVQKWPEINGRQFTRTDGRTDMALDLGGKEEDFRKYEKEEGRTPIGRRGEGIINHKSRCDSDSMCTIRRHLTPPIRCAPLRSSNDLKNICRTNDAPAGRPAFCPGGGRIIDRFPPFVGFECRRWRPERGTIFWRFL